MNEEGQVIRNKTRLVCKRYAQVEGIDFEEIFSHVAILESRRMFLDPTSYKAFKAYHMYAKSTFLNCDSEEEVCIEQPEGFQLPERKDYTCKLRKYIYGLKQAPRAWYARLDNTFNSKDSRKGQQTVICT